MKKQKPKFNQIEIFKKKNNYKYYIKLFINTSVKLHIFLNIRFFYQQL